MAFDFAKAARWITAPDLADAPIKNIFHRQLQRGFDDGTPARPGNRHILFRKKFTLENPDGATLYITADDYYKLYVNGTFVGQGPAPAYPSAYRYNEIDLSGVLHAGENVIAVHVYYQGLINRVWVSGDNRTGLALALVQGGAVRLSSDETFLTAPHTAYSAMGKAGYDTQYLECYDSRDAVCGFAAKDFDDSAWEPAKYRKNLDYTLKLQDTPMLTFEKIAPKETRKIPGGVFFDFGTTAVGYLALTAKGKNGQKITLRYGQELCEGGRVRFDMRCNCRYEEAWILSGEVDTLKNFDYKSFRYAEVIGEDVEILDCFLSARHQPFTLRAKMNPAYEKNPDLCRIWDLCVNSQRLGVQEVIQDCMDREKGFYLGDGCYTALTNAVLTGDDRMLRKLLDDGFSSTFISEGLVTCADCSCMQEIAEYPLIAIDLMLWHYRLYGDKNYLQINFERACRLLDGYRKNYERDGLLSHLDRWCVVEWPANFRDGYDVDITEGKICEEAHVSINAYYLQAVRTVNKMAALLGAPAYRDEAPLLDAFYRAFYDREAHAFRDGVNTNHKSYVAALMPFSFGFIPDEIYLKNTLAALRLRGITDVLIFVTFPALRGLILSGHADEVKDRLLEEGAYLRMLREGSTTTIEGWGKDSKWNTSLFHLTLSYAALFLSDTDLKSLFE